MQTETGLIKIIQEDENGERAVRVSCPGCGTPHPGRYFLAYNPSETQVPLGQPLFPVGMQAGLDDGQEPLLGPVPKSWNPGDRLQVRGPVGRGFELPATIHRLALAAFGATAARLLPLIPAAIQSGADIALFTHQSISPSSLPAAVEIHPLNALGESLSWAGFLAIDIPLEGLPNLRKILGLGPHERIPCQAEALVWTPMSCGATADCGACAVPSRKGNYRLACKDGPVFNLHELDW